MAKRYYSSLNVIPQHKSVPLESTIKDVPRLNYTNDREMPAPFTSIQQTTTHDIGKYKEISKKGQR